MTDFAIPSLWKYADRLKTARIEAGMLQDEVAARSKVGTKSISSFETGRRIPRIDQLLAILKAESVPPWQFFDDDYWICHERRDTTRDAVLTSGRS